MKRMICAAMLLALAGCGVDGPPVPPPEKSEAETAERGLTISGTIEAGVAGSF